MNSAWGKRLNLNDRISWIVGAVPTRTFVFLEREEASNDPTILVRAANLFEITRGVTVVTVRAGNSISKENTGVSQEPRR